MSPLVVRPAIRGARSRSWLVAVATLLVALCALPTVMSTRAAAATGTADFSGWVGTDDFQPIAGARVLVTDRFDVGPGDFSDEEFRTATVRGVAATTDANGVYDAPGLAVDETSRDVWVVARVPGRGLSWHRHSSAAPEQPVPTKAGDRHTANVTYPADGGVLRGSVAVRGGRSTEGARLTTMPTGTEGPTVAHAGTDGAFEMAVPAGAQHLRISSRLGIERFWPGTPHWWGPDATPPIQVTAGQQVDLGAVELPADGQDLGPGQRTCSQVPFRPRGRRRRETTISRHVSEHGAKRARMPSDQGSVMAR